MSSGLSLDCEVVVGGGGTSLHNAGLVAVRGERQLPGVPDGAPPPVTAPPLHGAKIAPQSHLGPESLAEDEVDEGVQADV